MKKFLFLLVSVLFSVVASATQFVIFNEAGIGQVKFAVEADDTLTLTQGEIILLDGVNPEGVAEAIIVGDGWTGKIMSDEEADTYLPGSTTFVQDNVVASDGADDYTYWTVDGRYIPSSTIHSGNYNGNIVVAKGIKTGKAIKFVIIR